MAVHLIRPITVFLTALALVFISMATPSRAQGPAVSEQTFDISLADLLDDEGKIHLREDFSGSIDPAGFEVIEDPEGELRFRRLGISPNGQWSEGKFGVPGCNGFVEAMATINGHLYLGGEFQACGLTAVSHVARFDPDTGEFSALGDGVSNQVNALTAIGTDLYVGGFFLQAGGAAASRIAKYDTTQVGNAGWSALGDGANSTVQALAAIGTDLYVGGGFIQAGIVSASFIAKYDTTQAGNAGWSALGDGVNNGVFTLAAIGTDLYVGGAFTQGGGAAASRIAKYDTTQVGNAGWSELGDGVNNTLRALAAIGTDLYVGGLFSQAGGAVAIRIAKYDTTQTGNASWSALGDGANDTVDTLAAIGTDLYVGGLFNQTGGTAANLIAKYDTTQTGNAGWSALGDGVNNRVRALAAIGTDLYAGGLFSRAGSGPASQIAYYDITKVGNAGWSELSNGINGTVDAMAAIGTDLYVGGTFTRAGNAAANRIAKYDTTQVGNAGWSALGDGVNRTVRTLAAIGTDLYVGGGFNQAGNVPASFIAKYDTNQAGNAGWSALGDGVNNGVFTLAAIGTDLYVGGAFTQGGGTATSRIAKYDTTQVGNAGWSALGDGANSTVQALAAIGTDLYVGGLFGQAGGSVASQIAKYDTTLVGNAGWSTLGDGVNGDVEAMAVIGSDLYVGGTFTEAGSAAAVGIAKYDTSQVGNTGWSALGDGVNNNFVAALAAIGTDLYVAGFFTQAGGVATALIAKYDTTQVGNAGWSALGDGINDAALALTALGTDLYVGGLFDEAGGKINAFIARYQPTADLIVEKTSGSYYTSPGEVIDYEILVVNAGPSHVSGAQFIDIPPLELANVSWTCSALVAALCQDNSGIDLIDQTVDLQAGGSLLFILSGTLPAVGNDPVTNTATVVNPITELDPTNNIDSDTDLVGLFADSMESIEP